MSTKPVMEIRKNGIKISFWENETDDRKRFYSAKVIKSYFDEKKKEWIDTDYFSEYDLPLLALMVQKASLELIKVKSLDLKNQKVNETNRSEITVLIEDELNRIWGTGQDKKDLKASYLIEVLKACKIDKTEWKQVNDNEKRLVFAYLVKESPKKEGENDFSF